MIRCTLSAVFLVALLAVAGAQPATTNVGPPTSIAALGDSITTAACANGVDCSDVMLDSWATGTNPAVNSHLRRLQAMWNRGPLRAISKQHPVHAFNFASDADVTMADLAAQARQARKKDAEYVTIEIGENDLCGSTSIAAFRAELRRGLAVLDAGTHVTKVLLLSVENIVAHWRALQSDPTARKAFAAGYSLDCALGAQVPRSWLTGVEARTRALNLVEAEVCSTVPYCLYDGGTYFKLPLHARYFSRADYQHLSLAGQRALAAAEWKVALKIVYF
jgi:lysophospholipase L1-like esterase